MTRFRSFGKAPSSSLNVEIAGGAWAAPEETPVAFVYNRRNYAVMLATPADMEDFAIGFSLTERVADRLSDISSVDVHYADLGIELQISIAPERLERLDVRQQRRNLVGRAGCGLCGLENAETFFERLPTVSDAPVTIDPAILQRAIATLERHQPLNAETRTVHAAAWAGLDGDIRLAREDVGRHNALDKLLGALARDGADMADGFVVMSSRCSYEIIEKAARMEVKAVVSISAPTAFAIRKAREANLALYACADDGVVRIGAS